MAISKEMTDGEAIAWARSQGLSEKDRREIWASRHNSSAELRQEFERQSDYVGFMEGCFRGTLKIYRGSTNP